MPLPIKRKSNALKVKRDPNTGSWRYSFRANQMVNTGDAGPASYDEAEAFFAAYMKCYGYEPEDDEFPEGSLEAHDARIGYDPNADE